MSPQTTTYSSKMNSDGEWIWATSILSENIETASSISVAESGEIIVGGTMKCSRTTSNFVFSNTPLSEDQSMSQSFAIQCQTDQEPTGFVAHLDTNGGFLAAKEIKKMIMNFLLSMMLFTIRGTKASIF